MRVFVIALVLGADAALLISAFLQMARIGRATGYLRDHQVAAPAPRQGISPTVVVLVPMWREQGTVPSAIVRFSSLVADRPWASVLFLANDNDDDPDRGFPKSTLEVLEDGLRRCPAENIDVRLVKRTTKADKLRAAMASREVAEAGIVAVYDADSSPNGTTLDLAVDRLEDRLDQSVVLQQTSLHLSPSRRSRLGDAVGSSALRQTRWSLHFELGRLLPRRRLRRVPQQFRRFRYIIGHGVFFTGPAVRLALPIDGLLIEDSYMSLSLKEAGLPVGLTRIEPLPGLDASELPPSIWGALDQKARWYTGPRDAFDYFKPIVRRIPRERWRARLWILIEAAKLRLHAIYWFWGPPVYVGLLPALLLWRGAPVLLVGHVIVVAVHAWGVDVVTARATRRLGFLDALRSPLPYMSVYVWVLWWVCALPGFAKIRAWRTGGVAPLRAERSWEKPVRVEELV